MSCCRQNDQGKSPADRGSCCDEPKDEQKAGSGCCSSAKPSKSSCCSSYEEEFYNYSAESSCCAGDEHAEKKQGCCGGQEEAPEHIYPQMTIQEILSSFPAHSQRLAQELTQVGLQCVGCQAAVYETLELGMKRHGMDDAAVARLLERLNAILEERSDPKTVTLTSRAAKKYLAILESEGKEGYGLRFGDQPAGCSGFEYVLDYSEKAQPEDIVYVSQGIEIHVHQGAASRLEGSLIDYIDGLHASGFKVSNEKARSSCGCGSSHNY